MKKIMIGAAFGAMLVAGVAPAKAGAVLDAAKTAGSFKCAIGGSTPGFGFLDDKGTWQGFNVGYCQAVAIALFNDPTKATILSMSPQQRLTALQTGEIDMLASSTTVTLVRDAKLGMTFAPPVFYDGQGMMVNSKAGIKRTSELNGASICLQPGTTTELNLADFFRKNNMSFRPVVIESAAEVRTAFASGRCNVMSDDISGLAASRVALPNPNDYLILSERISKEPLAPSVRHGDDQWADIVRWSVHVLVEAEELGITKTNVDEMLKNPDPRVRRFLGAEPGLGDALGLDPKFAYNIVKHLGNYGEHFDRWLGAGSNIKLGRGLNALWRDGGLQYSPPFR